MINESYFEIDGQVYKICSSDPQDDIQIEYVKSVPIIDDNQQWNWPFPEVLPSIERPARRWDDTAEKRAQARKDYGFGGRNGTPRFKGYFG